MPDLPLLREVPEGFVLREGARGVLLCRRDHEACLRAIGYGPDGGGSFPSSDLSGRGSMGELEAADGTRLLQRPFRHGGLLRWLTGERFADPERPFHELFLSVRMLALGLPVCAVVAARAVRARGFGWRLDVVSERIADVVDLAAVLEVVRAGSLEEPLRRQLADALGALVGRMHRLGVWHADLQPRNMLVDQALLRGGPEARAAVQRLWLIDLEGSRVGALNHQARLANLRRLGRAVARREERGERFLRRSDWLRFLRGYERTWGTAEPSESQPWSWRRDWRGVVRASRGRSGWHRLGWWLEERFGHVERRDGDASVHG